MSTPIRDIKPSIDYSNKTNNNYSSIVTGEGIKKQVADQLITEALDLIDNKNFKPYFYKTLYIIGVDRFRSAMVDARAAVNARCRPCIFAGLLKQYRAQHGL